LGKALKLKKGRVREGGRAISEEPEAQEEEVVKIRSLWDQNNSERVQKSTKYGGDNGESHVLAWCFTKVEIQKGGSNKHQ
ncbi:hypothetical protein KI387_017271, partial [Taxus chinensis]